MMSISLCF